MIASAACAHFWLVVRSISNDSLRFQLSLYLVGTPLDDFLCIGISGLRLLGCGDKASLKAVVAPPCSLDVTKRTDQMLGHD